MSGEWAGEGVTIARSIIARTLPAQCPRCGKTIHPDPPGTPGNRSGWVVGHIVSRGVDPSRTWDPQNWRAEHRVCSDATGQRGVIEKAQADLLRSLGMDPILPQDTHATSRRPWESLAPQDEASTAKPDQGEIREALTWDRFVQDAPAWIVETRLLEVPENASPPLAMTPVHPEAVGSYGMEAVEWIEGEFSKPLRWWQRLALVRILEHREDGSLCWRTPILSASRRSGKSYLFRGLACWRLEHGPTLFGERQVVLHTGNDLSTCRSVQKEAWRWSESHGWKVTRGNGKEAIATYADDEWLVRAKDAVYGYEAGLALVDEGWDVPATAVDDGLEPATLERSSPQMLLTSTAHRKATSLMRNRIKDALTFDDGLTLLLLWSVAPGSDYGDPDIWRAASPHWSKDRAQQIAAKYAKALKGEQDPELDDPDPMAGFVSQYLNVWRLRERRAMRGDPVTTPEAWEALQGTPPARVPASVAIESWPSQGVSVARAWSLPDDRVLVSTTDHPTLAEAVEAVTKSGYKGLTYIGASMITDPALKSLRTKSTTGRVAASVTEILDLLRDDRLRHDGSAHLSDQVLSVRTVVTADGQRVMPGTRADAIKAVVWAVAGVKPKKASRMVLPSALQAS